MHSGLSQTLKHIDRLKTNQAGHQHCLDIEKLGALPLQAGCISAYMMNLEPCTESSRVTC